jgi:predicted metal-binding membrane protein
MSETEPRTQPDLDHSIPAAAAVVAVAAAAWVVLAAGVGHTTHDDVLGSGYPPDAAAIATLLSGWLLMVAAMMLPPEIASLWSSAAESRRPWWKTAGIRIVITCTVWTGFGIAALAGDTAVHVVADSWPELARLVAPAVLMGAGAYQLSAQRRGLLAKARRTSGSPLHHSLHCLGSCWALMLVIFALGVGDLQLMMLLSVVMTVERATTPGLSTLTGQLMGWALIGTGALAAIRPGTIG